MAFFPSDFANMSLNGEQIAKIASSDNEYLPPRIVKYPDLNNFGSIEELLSSGACVILYLTKSNYGHWTLLMKYQDKKGIEFFDSYGTNVDNELEWVPEDVKNNQGMRFPALSALLSKYCGPIHYNQYKFQGKGTSTCGRWVAHRSRMRELCIDCYKNYVQEYCSRRGISPDQAIVNLTQKYLI
jgi:hypothetical protein